MRLTPAFLGLGVLLLAADSGASQGEAEPARPSFRVGGGAERFGLVLPREERLEYVARVSLAGIVVATGEVTQSCEVLPHVPSVLLPVEADADGPGLETATIRMRAAGDYTLYSLDSTLEVRHFPQAWPRSIYRGFSKGSDARRYEFMLGVREGKSTLRYQKDTPKGAPKGTRIWKDPEWLEVPEGGVDMLTAVFLCRRLVELEVDELTFPLVDKDEVTKLTLRRSGEKRVQTEAGSFDAVEVLLLPEPWTEDGQTAGDEANDAGDFKGLFGLKGSIHLWVEKHSGVPLVIAGDLPAGPFTLGVDVRLAKYSGTTAAFHPVEVALPGSR